jgi:hypothetical protein
MMRVSSQHAQRGQVLPIWAAGIAAMLMLAMMVIRYADIVQWQIRAQNAADSAAQSVMALQTEQLNEMTSTLYAASVEEYRMRLMLYALGNTAYGNGGCSLDGTCSSRYANLYTAYLKSVYRYRAEVDLLSQITANLDFATTQTDAAALLAQMDQPATCGTGGLDCGAVNAPFSYKLLDYSRRTGTYSVFMDSVAVIVPAHGNNAVPSVGVNHGYEPARAEVSVCADVPSPVPGFFGFTPRPYRVVARSAVTAVMREQDWFQPGNLINPFPNAVTGTQTYYQINETPSGSTSNDGTGYDWYAIQYGGNPAVAYTAQNGYRFTVNANDFTKFLGWWSAVPIRPYYGTATTLQLGCSS